MIDGMSENDDSDGWWQSFTSSVSHAVSLIKGRTFFIIAGILAGLLVATVLLHAGIETWRDRDTETRSRIISALAVDDSDDFKYYLGTDAGNLVVQGSVTIPEDQCVTVYGMDGSVCAGSVEETREDYNMHVREYDCGSGDDHETCTEVYYSWDYAGSHQEDADSADFLGVTLPYGFVQPGLRSVSPGGIGISGCGSEYCYSGMSTRYSYKWVPGSYNGVAFLYAGLVEGDDKISMYKGFEENETADEAKDNASHPSIAPTVIFWIVEVLLIIGAGVGIVYIVSNDVNDGVDDGF